MEYDDKYMKTMAVNEVGSIIAAVGVGILAYCMMPPNDLTMKIMSSIVWFFLSLKLLLALVHLGYKPES